MKILKKYNPFGRKEILHKEYTLSRYDIEEFSSWVDEILNNAGVERQNNLRIRLSMEEAILRYRDHFGEEAILHVTSASRFGKPYIQIELEEEAYNPLSSPTNEIEDWSGSLLTAVGLQPQYSYSNRKNILRLVLPDQSHNPTLRAAGAIFFGILIGLIGVLFIGRTGRIDLVNDLYDLIFDFWTRILNLLSGPVIFFMTITTVLGTGKIAGIGGNSKNVLLRYFLMSLLAALMATIAVRVVFGIHLSLDTITAHGLQLIRELMISMMPSEIFSPFMESNTPQLLFIAFVIGSVLNAIGTQADDLSRMVRQINMVGLLLTERVGTLVPIFTCFLIALEITSGRLNLLTDVPWCLFIAFMISTTLLAAVIFYVGRKMDVPFFKLLNKLKQPFALTISAGSINAAVGQTENCCVNELGIDQNFTNVSLAYGWILYLPASIIGTLIFTLYTANRYHVIGGPLWLLAAIILSVLLFVATPPVPGANLLAFAVIFSTLGIPEEALTDAMVFDIVSGIYSSAVNQAMLQMELVLQAHKIRILNVNKLRQ